MPERPPDLLPESRPELHPEKAHHIFMLGLLGGTAGIINALERLEYHGK